MKKTLFLFTALIVFVCAFAQDVIITKDSKKIEAKIVEVSKSEIKYKEFDYQDGPTFILGTDEIATITYGNGKVVVYNQTKSQEELAREHAQRAERARQQAELEQNDIEALDRVREQEERSRQAEAVAKANSIGSLFGQTERSSGAGFKGNPIDRDQGGSSWTLSGRGIRGTFPQPSNNFNQEGKVVVQIRVNAAGDVIGVKCMEGTSVTDHHTQQLALDAAKKAKFTKGNGEQVGTITYIFKFN